MSTNKVDFKLDIYSTLRRWFYNNLNSDINLEEECDNC